MQTAHDSKSAVLNLEPTTGAIIAGSTMHQELNTLSYFTAGVKRPLCAILGGNRLDERIKLIDSLIDRVGKMPCKEV